MDKPKRLYIWDDDTGSYILYDKQQAQIDELVSAVEFLSKNIAPHGLNTLLRNGSTTGELIAKHKGE